MIEIRSQILVGFVLGIFSIVVVVLLVPPVESGVPPTPAIKQFVIVNDVNTFPSTEDTVTAENYRDTLYFGTDGSINLNITAYP